MFFNGTEPSSLLKCPVPVPLPLATAFWSASDEAGALRLLGLVRDEGAVGEVESAGTTWSGRFAFELVEEEGCWADARAWRSRSCTFAFAGGEGRRVSSCFRVATASGGSYLLDGPLRAAGLCLEPEHPSRRERKRSRGAMTLWRAVALGCEAAGARRGRPSPRWLDKVSLSLNVLSHQVALGG